jgi:hypothetical protein
VIVSILASCACVAASLLQLAVLRDKTIQEVSIRDRYRTIRVLAYGLLALTVHSVTPPIVALGVAALALADAMSAVSRLFPQEG